MDDAEVEWRAHTTQICRIEADAEKHHQEVLTMTNVIEDAIQKNNVIFGEKWEMTPQWATGLNPGRNMSGICPD